MWINILSAIKKIDIASFICEEVCRYCGQAVPSASERKMSVVLEKDSASDDAILESGPPTICLCVKCGALIWKEAQSLWWLPVTAQKQSSYTVEKPSPTGVEQQQSTKFDHNQSTVSGTTQLLPVATATMYEGPMQKLIRRLKYDDDRLVVADIGPLLIRAYEMLLTARPQLLDDKADILLVPIPLHPSRQRERGYNQAALIAKEFAKSHNLKVDERLLKRKRKTRPQYGLGRQERLRNIEGAFELGSNDIGNKTVILVDDVFTSGATFTSCAALLTECGAKEVAAMAAARAPYDKRNR